MSPTSSIKNERKYKQNLRLKHTPLETVDFNSTRYTESNFGFTRGSSRFNETASILKYPKT